MGPFPLASRFLNATTHAGRIEEKFKEHCQGAKTNNLQSYFYLKCEDGLESAKKVLSDIVKNGTCTAKGMEVNCTGTVNNPSVFNSTNTEFMGCFTPQTTNEKSCGTSKVKLAFTIPPSEGFTGILSEDKVAKLIKEGKGQIKSFFPIK